MENGDFLRVSNAKLKSDNRLSSVLSIDTSGSALCVGTADGLFRLKGSDEPEDVLQSRDQNVQITAVLGSQNGGCWFAGKDGTIGFTDKNSETTFWHLPQKAGDVNRLVKWGKNHLWVLTEKGAWLTQIR